MIPKFTILKGKEVKKILNQNTLDIFDIIEKTYLSHENKMTINPESCFLRYPKKPNSRIIALPAHIDGDPCISGIKWVASNPDNITKNIPRASAVLILNDYETGYPIACMEASIISATRTAASAVLAAREIKNHIKIIKKLGIIGNGIIAKYIYDYFCADNWQINQVLLNDLDTPSTEKLKNHIGKSHSCEIVDDICNLVQQCDVVVFATSALQPYIDDVLLLKHNPLLLNISLRDLSPKMILAANNVVDDVKHVLNANTSPHLAFQLIKNTDFINGTLGALIQKKYTLNSTKANIFSPMGLGVLDLALGSFVYEQSTHFDALIIDDFFYETNR